VSRADYWGKLGIAELPSEVRSIWYSRNEEPKPCGRPLKRLASETDELEVLADKDLAHKLIEVTPLGELEEMVVAMHICAGFTLVEIAEKMNISNTRVAQIFHKAMRKFRRAAFKLHKDSAYD